MSTKIQGITIKLGADASGLETALKSVNKDLSSTQKQLTSVNKALDIDPGNLELVAQKERLLGEAADQAAKKLESLKAMQAKISENIGSDPAAQSQYDALTREISKTELTISNLNKEQQAFATHAQGAKVAASSLGQGLAHTASTAESVATATAAMSAAASAAIGGMVGLAVKGSEMADEWATLSQQVGLSTDTIQKFQYASDQIDVDMGTLVSAVTRMKAGLSSSNEEFSKLGIKTKTTGDQFRDIESIFWDSVRAISEIGNETERDQAAMKIFGKNANELAGILDDGGKKMQALGNEAEQMGLIVSDEDIEKLTAFNDALAAMKAQLTGAFGQLAVPIVEAIMPLINQIATAIKKVASSLANVNPLVLQIVGIILLVIAAISPLASLIASVSLSLLGLSVAGPMAAAGLSSLLPYIAVIAAAAVLGVALGSAVAALADAFQELKAQTGSTSGAISAMIQSVAQGNGILANLAGTVVSAFSPVAGAILNIAGGVSSGLGVIKEVFNKITNIFQSFQDKASKFGSDIIKSFADGIKSAVNSVINAVKNLIDMMSQLWGSAERDASNAGSRTARAYVDSYNNNTRTATLTKPTFASSGIRGYGGGGGGDMNSAVASAINNLAQSITRQNSATTNVNVELVGSARNIFDTVRVQNAKMQTATGYHALA